MSTPLGVKPKAGGKLCFCHLLSISSALSSSDDKLSVSSEDSSEGSHTGGGTFHSSDSFRYRNRPLFLSSDCLTEYLLEQNACVLSNILQRVI